MAKGFMDPRIGRQPTGHRGRAFLSVAIGLVSTTACWSSSSPGSDVSEQIDDALADLAPDRVDFDRDETASDFDAGPIDEGTREDGAETVEDAVDDAWPPLPPGCLDSHTFPEGSVGCSRGVPRCPDAFPYCCDTNLCGSMEFGARGCCTLPDCGDSLAYHCIEVIGDATPQVCTRPEPEFRCPAERPFCCFNLVGAAVCADHALLAWDSCENQWAAGGSP